jgi:hypothetical protein
MAPYTKTNFVDADRIVGTIRTAVPGAVGYLIASLVAANPQVGEWIAWFDENLSQLLFGAPLLVVLQTAAVGAATAAYYYLVRWVGDRFPAVEKWFLGSGKKPSYSEKAVG